jgi:hypothetical protein
MAVADMAPDEHHPTSQRQQSMLVEVHLYTCKATRVVAAIGPAHSHSIINKSRKPAWLKGFAMIDIGHYRRFYRHPTRALSGAEDGGICGATTLAIPSSIAL